MCLKATLGKNVRKPFIFCVSFIVIVSLWFIEKTKKIPQYGIIFYELGLRCENKCGQNKQLDYFQKAVRLNSNLSAARYKSRFSDAYYRSGLIYEERGDPDRALEFFKSAAEVNRWNSPAYYRIGRYFFMKDSYEIARRYFLHCYRGSGCPDDSYYYLAQIYDKTKEYQLAISYYGEIVLLHPEYAAKVYPRLAELYYLLNDQGNTLAIYLDVLRGMKKDNLVDQLEQNFHAYQASHATVQ